jgi:hypothetical protein
MYKAKVAACSDIRKKQTMQSERRVEIRMLNQMVRKETTRI